MDIFSLCRYSHWKMNFNPDPTKPAQEVIFSRKLKTIHHPSITFNNNPISLCPN